MSGAPQKRPLSQLFHSSSDGPEPALPKRRALQGLSGNERRLEIAGTSSPPKLTPLPRRHASSPPPLAVLSSPAVRVSAGSVTRNLDAATALMTACAGLISTLAPNQAFALPATMPLPGPSAAIAPTAVAAAAATWATTTINNDAAADGSDNSYNQYIQLNTLRRKPQPASTGRPGTVGKSGIMQISDNAQAILSTAVKTSNVAAETLGLGPCLLSQNDVMLNRPRRQIKFQLADGSFKKISFMAYHVTWSAAFGDIPDRRDREYSHRCHQSLCVEPRHGIWEQHHSNIARNECKERGSHWRLPNGVIIKVCRHQACCLAPVVVESWEDERVLQGPSAEDE